MKKIDNGCFYTVEVSEREVAKFAERWPCFGETAPIWFQYDKRNGDLVDMSECPGMDERGLLALSHDAQEWGVQQ